MPELPEVETIMRMLNPLLLGKTIRNVKLNRPNLRTPFPDNFISDLCNAIIIDSFRRAKIMVFITDKNQAWLIHLGMSGRFRTNEQPIKHDHVIIDTGENVLLYNDPRRFGMMDLVPLPMLHDIFRSTGPEPLNISSDDLEKQLSNKKSPIKTTLLDQKIIAGLGNIYVCEALFISNIHPARPANSLNNVEITNLTAAIKSVLTAAIAKGGSTLRDYRTPDDGMGGFQHDFLVYGRNLKPCFTCNQPINVIKQGGRSTFFCVACQV
jgi:formamidopyrimidine-DNA glycosylase